MWGKEQRLLTGPLLSLSTRQVLAWLSVTLRSSANQLQFKALLLWRHPTNELPLRMPGLNLRLLVPSLCSGTWNATHSLRSHSRIHSHARIPFPTLPSHVHKPGRLPFVFVLRTSGSPLSWPLSSWVPLACLLPLQPLCPCCALGEKRQPQRCDQRFPRGLSYGRRLGLQGWPPACALFVFP